MNQNQLPQEWSHLRPYPGSDRVPELPPGSSVDEMVLGLLCEADTEPMTALAIAHEINTRRWGRVDRVVVMDALRRLGRKMLVADFAGNGPTRWVRIPQPDELPHTQ